MGEDKTTKRVVLECVLGLIVIVWSFVILNNGFYMDESGMLTIYRGIYLGNRMMVDAWGAHQMGWFLVYPFMALYDVIAPLCTAYGIGFVLYMRICYQIFRLLVAIYLYITIRRTEYRNSAFIVALTYYAYFLSFKNFSYKSMCEMSIMLFLCWAYRYFQTKNAGFYVLMAIATSAAILAYPSMILFPVIFVIAQFVMMYKGYELLKPTVLYCITCFVLGIAVVLYIQFTAGIQNVLPQLQYTEDAAYKYPIYTRLGIMFLSYVAFAVIAYAPILVMKIIGHFRYISEQTVHLVLAIYWLLFMGAVIGLRPFSTSTTRYIYGCLVVMFWFPYLARNKKDHNRTEIGQYRTSDYNTRNFINFIIFISATCQLIWSVTTNQEVTVPGYMGFYLVLGVLIISEAQDTGLRILRVSVVAFTLFFMGFWVAEADGGYNDILEHRTVVENGGYMGIALDDFDYAMNRSCHNLIEQYVADEDRLYIVAAFGTTGYLDTKAIQAAGSPFSRVGVGQLRVLEFWQVNPDRQPDYILVDTANKYYEEYTQGETYKYISENYPVTLATDGNVILLSK